VLPGYSSSRLRDMLIMADIGDKCVVIADVVDVDDDDDVARYSVGEPFGGGRVAAAAIVDGGAGLQEGPVPLDVEDRVSGGEPVSRTPPVTTS